MKLSNISPRPIAAPDKLRTAIQAQLSAEAGIALSDAQKFGELFREPAARETKPPMDRTFLLADDGKPLHVQVFGQFDLHASGLIRDRVLGTVGILQVIPPLPSPRPTDKNLEELREWFRQRIDEATYLRHLLVEVTREDGREPHAQPYTVELVFIPCDESVASLPLAGEILRPLMRETTFLHAIGVNLWRHPLQSPGHQRRAFSWLMNETRKWLASQQSTGGAPARRFAGLTTQHFRLAGKRDLRLAKDQTLHLIHGHNGSGKSSIVEALELAVTGKVERIEERRQPGEQATYRNILTNRNARKGAAAKMTLHWAPEAGRKVAASVVTAEGIASPLQQDLKAGAFRMDQRLADRLAAGSPAERARVFMETFFADRSVQISEWLAAREKFDECIRQLPETDRAALAQPSNVTSPGEADPKIAVRDLGWVAGDEISWPRVRSYVRLNEETLTSLEPLFPKKLVSQLREKAVLSSTRMAGMAKEVDEALERQRGRAAQHGQTFAAAAAVLEALSAHTVAQQAASDRSLPELMNDWLELHALTDLIEKEHLVLSTIETAREGSYVFHGDRTPVLADRKRGGSRASREAALSRLRKECDEARRLLGGTASRSERAAKARTGGAADALPATLDFAALDEVARLGAFGEEFANCEPPLGHAVRIAFQEHRIVEVRAGSRILRVGEKGWGDEILSRLRRVSGALEAFAPAIPGPPGPPLATLLPLLQQTYRTAKGLLAMDRKVVDDFAQLIGNGGPFSVAINEFMALLTPARWAYEDLTPQVNLKHAAQEFEFAVDKVPAQLRLNTAELNTLALGFFLLCARRVTANPLRLLILDDPLQNMDEFTVTTVARGLCKLLRMWKTLDAKPAASTTKTAFGSAWQILLLLHGEEDVERVRSEAPCTIYYLPWLSPDEHSAGVAAPKIEFEHSWMQRELQSLQDAFAQIA
ncbi:MAG: hypothetical protein QOE70_964 [Chthoniobacter sp.]|jgi:recombinational DNA repair ATPase RecF|nr:hypothetical protein [Chthoniobacter sp.]